MNGRAFLIWAALAILVLAGSASAGIMTWEPQWTNADPLNLDNSGWHFDAVTETWTVWEDYVADGTASLGTVGSADVDPIIHVEKTVTNNSTFVWSGYHVEIVGSAGVSYVANSATSDVFGTIVESGGVIDYSAPDSVPIGQTVTITFDVEVPAGQFSLGIEQTPVPEPATLLLLLGGGIVALGRRIRRGV